MAVSNVSFSLCLLVILQEQQVCFKERSGEQEMGCGSPLDVSAYQVSWIVLDNVLLCLRISVLWISEYIALVLPLIVCVPVNCVMNRYRAFR